MKVWCFALVFVLVNLADGVKGLRKVRLSVYYESQCPDSKTFVLQQLQPAMQLLHRYVDLQLVPFGKSRCVKRAELRTDRVEKCSRTRRGVELQMDSEYLTLLMKPKFIPTIAVDSLFNQHVQDNAMIDLTDTLCAEPALEKTAACAQYYNSLALRHLFSYPLDEEAEDIPLYKYQTYFYID